jgi:hypothetical protein
VPKGETATDPNSEITGVLEGEPDDEAAGVTKGGAPSDETAGVLEGDEESTGVSLNGNEQAHTKNNQPIEDDDSDEEDKFHEEIADEDIYHPDTMTPSVQRTYGMRPRKPRDYSHRHTMVIHHAITQYSVKSGSKNFKEKGENAISKELMQLHLRNTFVPQDSKKLSMAQKAGALESLMFL